MIVQLRPSASGKAFSIALRCGQACSSDLAIGFLYGSQDVSRCKLRRAALEGWFGGIFDAELNLLGDRLSTEQGGHAQSAVDPRRNAGGAYQFAMDHDSFAYR